ERLRATLQGQPVDRPAWSLWRHFYETEATVEGLAESMLGFQNQYGFDFMKVNPRAQYHVEDWGVKLRYSGNAHEAPTVVDVPIKTVADWRKVEPLPSGRGILGEHLRALRLIATGLKDEIPFIMTVFNPLSLAGRLVQDEATLKRHLAEDPNAVHQALEAITQTFIEYTEAILATGASGLFFATTTWGSRDLMSAEEYEIWGRPYDLRVLAAAKDAEFNLLHVCGDNNRLFDLSDYPVHAFNWAATSPSNPSIAEAARRVPGTLIGGISREALLADGTAAVLAEARHAADASSGKPWALGPNCSIQPGSRPENIQALRGFVHKR
ncbi:MAG TPA: uroporphyrinogen decarboxylase family protein, partial [Chloroflexota bacterium]|nr:uroporphyrinogen decarboxylase family protein [Chloroflexota bacterium]